MPVASKSIAQPLMCCDVAAAPEIALFNCSDLKKLFTIST